MDNNENKQLYTDVKGTGALSSVIFSIAITILMWLASCLVD